MPSIASCSIAAFTVAAVLGPSTAPPSRAQDAAATDAVIRDAFAMAAISRHWSTVLNGMQADLATFKAETDTVLLAAAEHAKSVVVK